VSDEFLFLVVVVVFTLNCFLSRWCLKSCFLSIHSFSSLSPSSWKDSRKGIKICPLLLSLTSWGDETEIELYSRFIFLDVCDALLFKIRVWFLFSFLLRCWWVCFFTFQQQKVDSLSSSLSWCHSRQVDLSAWLSCWCCFTWNCLGVWFLSTFSFHWAIPVELSLFSPLLVVVVVMLLMMMLHEIMGGTVIRSLVDLKRREWEERESLWDKQVLRDVHESDEIERKMENRWSFPCFYYLYLWLLMIVHENKKRKSCRKQV